MLLCQSALGMYFYRRLPAAEWTKVMRARSATPRVVAAAVKRAERVAGRLAANPQRDGGTVSAAGQAGGHGGCHC